MLPPSPHRFQQGDGIKRLLAFQIHSLPFQLKGGSFGIYGFQERGKAFHV
jgi:hypothetical protein